MRRWLGLWTGVTIGGWSGTMTDPILQGVGGMDGGELPLWIALFALALVGVLALFVSSRKIERLQREQEEVRRRNQEMEERFSELFGRVDKNIQKMSREIVEVTSDVIREVEHPELGHKLRRVINTETRILNSTSTLLNFLKLKAGKVTLHRERSNLNRILDDVVGNLMESMESREDVELIFRIDKNLPKEVEADFGRLVEILGGLLENAIVHSGEGTVLLAAASGRSAGGKEALQFRILYRVPAEREEPRKGFFVPVYDEERGEYARLECFVAHELTRMMGGEIDVEFSDVGLTRIELSIPAERPDRGEQRKYRLSTLEATRKRVLIINRRREASEAIAEMFAYFRHETEVMDLEVFEHRRPPLARFDIFVVEEPLVDPMLVDFIRKIRMHRDLKVVSVRNIFAPETPHFDASEVDARLSKPLTIERVYGLIEEFYGMKSTTRAAEEEAKPKQAPELPSAPSSEGVSAVSAPVPEETRPFWEEIPVTPGVGLNELSRFPGATLLIVEDNEINRRMLLKVLERSGLELVTAENGEKAVEEVAREGARIDLVLMDINMPVMDGYTATRKIRELPGGERLPIIALSALSLQNEREKMREAGMDGFLPKPLDLGRLYTVFERYLPRKEGTRTVREPKPVYPEEIDMEIALEHTNRNELLLRELLAEFLELYGESDRQLEAWIGAGEYERAREMLVDLVGISGTIGATRFYTAVKELYKALLLHRMEKVDALLEEYRRTLQALCTSIGTYLESVKG